MTKIFLRLLLGLLLLPSPALLQAGSAPDEAGAKAAFLDYWSALASNDVDRLVARLHGEYIAQAKDTIVYALRKSPVTDQQQACRDWFHVDNVAAVERLQPKVFIRLVLKTPVMGEMMALAQRSKVDPKTISAELKADRCNLRIPVIEHTPDGDTRTVLNVHLVWSAQNDWQIISYDSPDT